MSADRSFIHPDANEALERAIIAANLRPKIVQTQGNATASAGTHGAAGTYKDNAGKSHSYSACIDFSVNQMATRLSDGAKVPMNAARIHWFLEHLAEQGIVAWYRRPSQGFDAAHIHAVTAMVPISIGLVEAQVIDFLNDRTGLKGHAKETFWTADEAQDAKIAALFAKANPEAAKRLPARFRK